MILLKPTEYYKVFPLITSRNDVTIFSVLVNTIDGEVIVDNENAPSCVLIKAPGVNYVAGSIGNKAFNNRLSSKLDFWDQLTPDDEMWRSIIAQCHPNKYIRQYTRCHYELSKSDWQDPSLPIMDGYLLEKVDLPAMRLCNYKNERAVYDWAADYRDDGNFMQNGTGYYIRNADRITNWSLSDGHYQEKIAIGVRSDEKFRKKGLSILAVAATINECFQKGFTTIEWLCVDFNKGSRAIAERLGFNMVNTYCSFTSYPPCENYLDLSETKWNDWGAYFEAYSAEEPRLLGEQLLAYVKGNNDKKAKEAIRAIGESYDKAAFDENKWLASIPKYIDYFHSIGMSESLSSSEWADILNKSGIKNN